MVTHVETHRIHNATSMLSAEFPSAPHPQVFAMLFLWMNYGRHLAFIDTSDQQWLPKAGHRKNPVGVHLWVHAARG